MEKTTYCPNVYSCNKQGAARATSFSWCAEAESGLGNRSVESNSQASGGQVVGGFGSNSEYMDYFIPNIPATDSYTLYLWYSSGDNPQFGMLVNGSLQNTSAPGNSSWTGPFIEKTVTINLTAGSANSLRIQGAGGNFVLDRLCIEGTGDLCNSPSLSLGTPTCSGTSTYTVGFSAQAGATVTSSAGSVQGSQVINIPVGTNVTVTATLNGCFTQQSASSPTCGSTPGDCSGSGLVGNYYNTTDFSQSPVSTRTDTQINFNWGTDSPIPGTVNTDFSIRWQGQVEAPVTGSYTFKTYNDDGTRLWVNGQLIIDDWNGHAPEWRQGSISLTGGQKYNIKIEFVDFFGGAQARLYWQYPGQTDQIVPSCRLYATTGSNPCSAPSLSLGTPTCSGTSTYTVGFSAQAGATVTSSAGSVQGSQVINIPVGTNVTVTATLNGCSTQQTANSPTCSTTPNVPVGDWLAFENQPGLFVNDLATLENSTSKAQFRLSLGGELAWLGLKSRENVVCTIKSCDANFQDCKWLAGRNWGAAWYMSPQAGSQFCIDGSCIGPGWGIGNDPVLGGSINVGDISQITKAAIITDPVRGQVYCVQSRPKQWDFLNKPGHLVVNMEHWFVPGYPDVLATRFKVVIELRSSTTSPATNFEGMSQEEPSVYMASKFRAPLYTINGQDVNVYDMEGIHEGARPPKKIVTDNFAGGRYLPDLSYGLTLYTPDNNYFTSWRSNPQWGENGGETDPSWGFLDKKVYRNLDIEGWYESQTVYNILGSRAVALQRLTQLPQPLQDIDFDLTDPTNHSHMWSNSSAPMKNENGELALYIGQGKTDNGVTSWRGAIYSPYRRWDASTISSIQVTCRVTGGASLLSFIWQKADANGNLQDFEKTFPVISDGVLRTYTISLADVPNWSGFVARIGVGATPNTPTSAKLYPKRIKKVN